MGFVAVLDKKVDTLEDFVHQLGDVPLRRILMKPLPGTAKVKDLIARLEASDTTLCELIDGVLVEKDMGLLESLLGAVLLQYVNEFLEKTKLGIASGSDGPFRILPSQVRLPDVSVILWDSLPDENLPEGKVPRLAPDIAVEVISKGNTKKEMERKLRDYFKAGVKQVWYVYPKTKSADVYSSPTAKKRLSPKQALTGGDILPGFELPLAKLFARIENPKTKKGRNKK